MVVTLIRFSLSKIAILETSLLRPAIESTDLLIIKRAQKTHSWELSLCKPVKLAR